MPDFATKKLLEEGVGRQRETFVVRILYQQNNTWQGEVLWAEQNQKQYFRSALELLSLMDSAVKEGREEERTGRERGESREADGRDGGGKYRRERKASLKTHGPD